MSGISKIAASNPVPQDLARSIGRDGVNEILGIFWQSYKDMVKDKRIAITSGTEEDDITQEWYQKLVKRWDSRNRATCISLNRLYPHHQYSDSTLKKRKGCKSPTIDFCFREWDMSDSYFGAECKNLYHGRQDKITRYIRTGIDNYIAGRYGSRSSEGAVIGYVLSGKAVKIVEEIKRELRKDLPIMNLSRMMEIPDLQYKSMHKRHMDGQEITLYHLFFDFTK